jgi:hypothetical protein
MADCFLFFQGIERKITHFDITGHPLSHPGQKVLRTVLQPTGFPHSSSSFSFQKPVLYLSQTLSRYFCSHPFSFFYFIIFYIYLHVYTLFGPPPLSSHSPPVPLFWLESVPPSSSPILMKRKPKR